MGILVHKALARRSQGELAAFQCLLVLAVLYEWRHRNGTLASSMVPSKRLASPCWLAEEEV